MSGRCDQCKHWVPDEGYDWQVGNIGFGICVGIRARWKITDEATENLPAYSRENIDPDIDEVHKVFKTAKANALLNARAYVQDGSEYIAQLVTGPDFYCALFAPKLSSDDA